MPWRKEGILNFILLALWSGNRPCRWQRCNRELCRAFSYARSPLPSKLFGVAAVRFETAHFFVWTHHPMNSFFMIRQDYEGANTAQVCLIVSASRFDANGDESPWPFVVWFWRVGPVGDPCQVVQVLWLVLHRSFKACVLRCNLVDEIRPYKSLLNLWPTIARDYLPDVVFTRWCLRGVDRSSSQHH